MTLFVKSDGVDITEGPTAPDRKYSPGSAFPLKSSAELKNEGWLPFEDVRPPYNPETGKLTGPTLDIGADMVRRVWSVVPLTAGEAAPILRAAVQARLDEVAAIRLYDSAERLATYANDPSPEFSADAAAFIPWRSTVWTYSIAELEKLQAGERGTPTASEFIAELPAPPW